MDRDPASLDLGGRAVGDVRPPEQIGIADQCGRHAGPLGLTAGELLGPLLSELLGSGLAKHVVNAKRVRSPTPSR